MKAKLTLTIEEHTKERAKRFAQKKGTSVSKMVEQFLNKVVIQEEDDWQPPRDSVTAQLAGSLPVPADEDYKEILAGELMKRYN